MSLQGLNNAETEEENINIWNYICFYQIKKIIM